MNKTLNQKAWLFVIPVFILVAFNAAVPLMTVVNYSFQETFSNNVFTWEGTRWFKQILRSDRFHAALGRQFLFTGIILFIQIPLGIFIALTMPKKGIPAKVLKVSNTGRHKIIDTECNSGKIKVLSHSSKETPSGNVFLSFDKKYTYAYGDSWIIE